MLTNFYCCYHHHPSTTTTTVATTSYNTYTKRNVSAVAVATVSVDADAAVTSACPTLAVVVTNVVFTIALLLPNRYHFTAKSKPPLAHSQMHNAKS